MVFTPFSIHYRTRPRCYVTTANRIYFVAGLLLRSLEYDDDDDDDDDDDEFEDEAVP